MKSIIRRLKKTITYKINEFRENKYTIKTLPIEIWVRPIYHSVWMVWTILTGDKN